MFNVQSPHDLMTCVAPGILALVPESQVQTELEIDELGHMRERREKDTVWMSGTSIWLLRHVRLLMAREDPVEIPLRSSGVELVDKKEATKIFPRSPSPCTLELVKLIKK